MPTRTIHVRQAELDSLDWEELRETPTQLCIGDADACVTSVYVDWNWIRQG